MPTQSQNESKSNNESNPNDNESKNDLDLNEISLEVEELTGNNTDIISIQPTPKKPNKKPPSSNGWNTSNQHVIHLIIQRLKFNRIVNNFIFFDLKKKESKLSWCIIVLSALSSVLSIALSQNLFPYSLIIIQWMLVLITFINTLISSYIKKQQFIDRINSIDRYLQQINKLIEEINITQIIDPEKRESYDDFCKIYLPLIKNLATFPETFSPSEWKSAVSKITIEYPELIQVDGTDNEVLWPWYNLSKNSNDPNSNDKKRAKSNFENLVIGSLPHKDSISATNKV